MSNDHKIKKNQAKQEPEIQSKARIDAKAELIEPIDFSFKDLLRVEELNGQTPRLPTGHTEPKKVEDKFASLGLKLGYNALKDLDGLFEWCTTTFAYPKQISILDLSFNCLGNIPNELLNFECLKSLYLHGNKIVDVSEIDKLVKLKHLQTLTIHGNPIETVNGTRHYIIAKLSFLRHLNFSGVSKADKQTALVWTKSNHKPLKAVVEGDNKQAKERKDSETEEN